MATYARITLGPDPATGAKRKPVLLKITGESDVWLRGIEVRTNGDEVAPKGVDRRIHLIDKSAITKRTPMRWNLHLAELEPVK